MFDEHVNPSEQVFKSVAIFALSVVFALVALVIVL